MIFIYIKSFILIYYVLNYYYLYFLSIKYIYFNIYLQNLLLFLFNYLFIIM